MLVVNFLKDRVLNNTLPLIFNGSVLFFREDVLTQTCTVVNEFYSSFSLGHQAVYTSLLFLKLCRFLASNVDRRVILLREHTLNFTN